MTIELLVSPYLQQPLRSYEEALRDRQRAHPVKPGEAPPADQPTSDADAQTVPTAPPAEGEAQ